MVYIVLAFEVGPNSHCFLSQTDLSTQLQWQRAEDPHGNPFVAIVLDPQRSTHLGTPQLKAFRAYPPEYNSPINNECPDGSISTNEQGRLELWGSCWNRYYELVRGCWRVVEEQAVCALFYEIAHWSWLIAANDPPDGRLLHVQGQPRRVGKAHARLPLDPQSTTRLRRDRETCQARRPNSNPERLDDQDMRSSGRMFRGTRRRHGVDTDEEPLVSSFQKLIFFLFHSSSMNGMVSPVVC
jgi:hypothetical protein